MSQEGPKAAVTVTIAGDSYTIRSGVPAAYTRECAAYLDRTIHEILAQGAVVEIHRAVILAALSLTDQLFQARAELTTVRRDMDRLLAGLTRTVEDGLAADDLA